MKYWIAVASREHVLKGVAGGFIQVCHGKVGPLKKMMPDDEIIYYSPVNYFNTKDICQKFTALAKIKDFNLYQFKMSDNFIPWRRNVDFFKVNEIEIRSIIQKLSFIKNKKNWGINFRYGLFEINENDFNLIKNLLLS